MKSVATLFLTGALLLSVLYSQEAKTSADALAFFENRIRPVLAEYCYECHSSHGKRKNDLALDTRDGTRKGGKTGPAVVPGDPDHSLLLAAIRHEHQDLSMPKNGPKLDDKVIADFTAWIKEGAMDPRDEPPAVAKDEAPADWGSVLNQRKKSLWSFQPITNPPIPEVPGLKTQPPHPVDRFLQAKQHAAGLKQNPPAERAVLLRRLSFLLNGLPPSQEMQPSFLHDPSPDACDKLVSQLLATPAYGETWGRHWLDWFRYADTHGSEGDPAIPHAWRYRDYVIKAFNEDMHYPQLVRESLAGDLIDQESGFANQHSVLGSSQFRLVLHGFTPTDALDEFVTFTDNQIDVVTKAFLGLTVSCARCHHHKFDPVSQEDYYALFGVFGSVRPAMIAPGVKNPMNPQMASRNRMHRIKEELRGIMAAEWKKTCVKLPALMTTWQQSEAMKKDGPLAGTGPWFALKDIAPDQFNAAREALQKNYQQLVRDKENFALNAVALGYEKTAGDFRKPVDPKKFRWFQSGFERAEPHFSTGKFTCAMTGDRIIGDMLPPGFHTRELSDKDPGVLMSHRFKNEGGKIWVRVAGQGGATARYVVENYPRTGLIYPKFEPKSDLPQWHEWNIDYWKGDMMHLEFTTAADAPVEAKPENTRSWFSMTDALYVRDPALKPVDIPPSILAGEPSVNNPAELAVRYQAILQTCVEAWEQKRSSPEQTKFLAWFVRHHLLPNTLAEVPAAEPLLSEYRQIEGDLPFPTRVPGVMEGEPFNQPLYVKGDLKQPAAEVSRRFLEALDPTPFSSQNSGRLQLAEAILAPTNPLTNRVIVNRVWHHLFGRGLVATVDNFGKLGSAPSHPELLDHLATWFRAHGGSIKELIRYLVATEAFQASSEVPDLAAEMDPNNELLTHISRRRLTAEAIRDSLLSLSGKMKPGSPGDGAGAGASEPYRSIYLKLVRNNLPPLLTAFDFPSPVTTRGSRDSTNVPAQSLALLNDPQIQAWARGWASRGKETPEPEKRVETMFQTAFSRTPDDREVKESLLFIKNFQAQEKQENEKLQQLSARQAKVEDELNVLRSSVFPDKKAEPATATVEPYAEWDFEKDAGDSRGRLPLQLKNGAKIAHGSLILDGIAAHAVSGVIPVPLEEKTLEAWVQLAGLNQAGSGLVTIQSKSGGIFDSIVYAEKESGRWMAGSEFYTRTQSFKAPAPEQEAALKPVHVAITWQKDGRVSAWREGKPYGETYQNKEPAAFPAGQSILILGCRHLPPEGNRLLKGRITRARLYDRALTASELEQTAKLEQNAVTDVNVLAALSPADREAWSALQKQSDELAVQLNGKTPSKSDSERAWAALAHALMNVKELIYLR